MLNEVNKMDKSKITQVGIAFEMYCNLAEHHNIYMKLLGSLNSEQLALLSVKIYNYLKEVYNIEK